MFRVSLLAVSLCSFLVHTSGIHFEDLIDLIQDAKEEIESEPETFDDVTYGDLGTFSMGPPWRRQTRPIRVPQGPNVLFTDLLFYSRDNPENPIKSSALALITTDTNFDPHRPTVVIVHGQHSNAHEELIQRLKTACLDSIDANVIVVNWGPISSYTQTVSDIRVIGAMIANALQHLVEHHDLNLGTVHLIGHGLGAHLCSYVSSDVGGVGRVTGLDPSELLFESEDNAVRLDPSDAGYVDVIHTNARPSIPYLANGRMLPTGHVDYYMYGGYMQPGCGNEYDTPLVAINHCSHQKSIEYLIQMFNEPSSCLYLGYEAQKGKVFRYIFHDPDRNTGRGKCVRVLPGITRPRLQGPYEVYPAETNI